MNRTNVCQFFFQTSQSSCVTARGVPPAPPPVLILQVQIFFGGGGRAGGAGYPPGPNFLWGAGWGTLQVQFFFLGGWGRAGQGGGVPSRSKFLLGGMGQGRAGYPPGVNFRGGGDWCCNTSWKGFAMHCGIGTLPRPPVNRQTENITFARSRWAGGKKTS